MIKKIMKVTELQWRTLFKNFTKSKKVGSDFSLVYDNDMLFLCFRKKDSQICWIKTYSNLSKTEIEKRVEYCRKGLIPFLEIPIEEIDNEIIKLHKKYEKLYKKIYLRKKPLKLTKRQLEEFKEIESLLEDINYRYKGYNSKDPQAIYELPLLIERIGKILDKYSKIEC